MSWARFDDRFPGHLKVLRLSDAAFRMHVTAICFACENMTDGEIADGVPGGLPHAPSGKRLAAALRELEQARLWERLDGGGWIIHDFLDWNPSAEELRAKRAARAEAGRRGGQRSGKRRGKRTGSNNEAIASANGKQTGSNCLSESSSECQAKTNPVPVPVPEEKIPPTPHERNAPARRDPMLASLTGGAPGHREDVQALFERFKRTVDRPGLAFRTPHDLQAVTLAEAIDTHGVEACKLVADEAPNDRWVTGEADERGVEHKSVKYVFGNPDAFARILAAAQRRRRKRSGKGISETMREAYAAEPDLTDYQEPTGSDA